MQIISGQLFNFSSNGSAQLALREFDVNFQVTSATAVIEGMDVEFANRIDHNLGRLQVLLRYRGSWTAHQQGYRPSQFWIARLVRWLGR